MAKTKTLPKKKVKAKTTGKPRNKNLTEAGYFKRNPDKASEAGKKSVPYSKFKYSVLESLGYDRNKDKDVYQEISKVSKKEFEETLLLMLMSEFKKVRKLSKSDEASTLLKVMARGLVSDASKGNTNNIKDILDRVYGRVEQKIDAKINKPSQKDIEDMTLEDATNEYLQKLNVQN